MLNLISLLDVDSMESLCDDLAPVLRILGIVVKGIQYVVPIILIIVGMLDFAKAVGEKDEKAIKKAQDGLIKKAIAAVCVYLVVFFVSLLMTIVGNTDYKECMPCVKNPFGKDCKALVSNSDLDE